MGTSGTIGTLGTGRTKGTKGTLGTRETTGTNKNHGNFRNHYKYLPNNVSLKRFMIKFYDFLHEGIAKLIGIIERETLAIPNPMRMI